MPKRFWLGKHCDKAACRLMCEADCDLRKLPPCLRIIAPPRLLSRTPSMPRRFNRLAHRPAAPPLPAAIAPGEKPAPFGRHRLGDIIDAGGAIGVAPAEPGEPHPAAGPEAVAHDRLIHIGRAARQMAAPAPDQHGERELIGAQQPMSDKARPAAHAPVGEEGIEVAHIRRSLASSEAITSCQPFRQLARGRACPLENSP